MFKLLVKALKTIGKPNHIHTGSNTMKVTLLGAASNLGKATSLMLKQSPLIDELCLHDTRPLDGFVQDLNVVDTKCWVTSQHGVSKLENALAKSSVVVVLACGQHCNTGSYKNIFDSNSVVIKELATSIAKYASKALVAIATEPINSIIPMFSEIMKSHRHYNPNAIFGITTIDQVRANKFVAEILGLDPECVVVPVIGGHTEKTIVPVLSQATPCNQLTNNQLEEITNSIRTAQDNTIRLGFTHNYLANSFSIARFVTNLVKALRGQTNIIECAFVKSNIHPQLQYMVSPFLLGPGGIMKYCEIPELSEYESCLLGNAVPLLIDDIKKGQFAGDRPMNIIDEQLEDKSIYDPTPNTSQCPPDHCNLRSLLEKN